MGQTPVPCQTRQAVSQVSYEIKSRPSANPRGCWCEGFSAFALAEVTATTMG
jgi:hypothetical protein